VIVDLLAFCQRYLKLDHVLLQLTEGGDQSKSLFLDLARQLIQFLSME
jgi:hypothetical protein